MATSVAGSEPLGLNIESERVREAGGWIAMSHIEIMSTFQARHIMAPLIPQGTVDVGMPVRRVRELLNQNSFDYGVVREGDRIIGLVARADLRDTETLLPSGPPVRRLELDYLLPETTPVSNLVRYLVAFPFQLVVRAKNVVGVVHQSDLNKHPVYAYFYCLVSRLEQSLSKLLQHSFPSVEDWRSFLPEGRWRQIDSRWKQAKAGGREVGHVHYLCFPDYTRILGNASDTLAALGFATRPAWEAYVGAMDELRNDVMHPVRDLIGGHRSVQGLMEIEERVRDLIMRTEGIPLKPTGKEAAA
jgi:hypothetical protein